MRAPLLLLAALAAACGTARQAEGPGPPERRERLESLGYVQ